MLVASVTFDLTHIFTLVFTSLLYQKIGIEKTIVNTVYNGDKIQSGDNYILPGLAEITWRQAEASCFNKKAKILVVEKDMDMKKIMTDLEVNSIWVGVYKSLTMDVFVDDEEKSVITSTDNDTIDHSGLDAFAFTETQAVILKKVNGDLKYETVLKTANHRCICMQKIPFPRRKADILGLKTLQSNLAQEISLLTDTVKISFSKIERSLLTLPKLNETELGNPISTVSMQSKLEEKINGLEELSNRTVFLWQNINSHTEIAEIITVQRKFVQTIRYVERFTRDILEEPLLLLDTRSLNEVGPESIISLGLSVEDSSKLLVTVEAKMEAAQIQDGSGMGGLVTPSTKQPPVTYQTSTQSTTEKIEATSTTAAAPLPQTTTTVTSTTTTTTMTTTVTYWYEAETTAAPGFAETWWVWIKHQFVGLQTAAEWLRLSIYFLTVWDILVGTLCLLNSAYILYKICENPNRGRVGETRFRTALVRLFGRKKEPIMPTSMSREEMPLQQMPSAPPMSVPMPQVKCMTAPMSVKMRTPTRRINIEEYAETSSESEEMPFTMRTRRVRYNDVPEVKIVKRRAPTPPTTLVTEYYLRDQVPYALDY